MSCHTCSALTWVLGPWTQVSTFTQQILSALGHCPSPLLTSIFSYKHTHVYDKGNLEDCFPAKMMSVLRIRTKKDFFSFLPVAIVCLLGDRGDGMYRSFKSVTSLLCQSNITFKFHLLFLFPTLMFALKRHLWRGKEGSSCTHTQEPIKRNSQCFDIKKKFRNAAGKSCLFLLKIPIYLGETDSKWLLILGALYKSIPSWVVNTNLDYNEKKIL